MRSAVPLLGAAPGGGGRRPSSMNPESPRLAAERRPCLGSTMTTQAVDDPCTPSRRSRSAPRCSPAGWAGGREGRRRGRLSATAHAYIRIRSAATLGEATLILGTGAAATTPPRRPLARAPLSTSVLPPSTASAQCCISRRLNSPASMPCSFHMYTPSATPRAKTPCLRVGGALRGQGRRRQGAGGRAERLTTTQNPTPRSHSAKHLPRPQPAVALPPAPSPQPPAQVWRSGRNPQPLTLKPPEPPPPLPTCLCSRSRRPRRRARTPAG